MSRRKQSNPKPLNKGECSETTEEMTVDNRDSKDLNPNELTADDRSNRSTDSHTNPTDDTDVEMTESLAAEELATTPTYTKMEHSPSEKLTDELQRSASSCSNSAESNSFDSRKATPELPVAKFKIEDDVVDKQSNGSSAASPQLKYHVARTPSPDQRELPPMPPETVATTSPSNIVPKLRLNALLASDPALKPDAKDLKAIHEETQTKNRLAQLPAPPALTKHEDLDSSLLASQPSNLLETPTPAVDLPPRIKVFMCLPCSIGFSSPSTLEAHQKYYCQHRNKEMEEEAAASLSADKSANISASPTASGKSANATSSVSHSSSAEPTAKSIKTGKQYACPQCSYSADKKVSLNRHMRMHQTSPNPPASNASNGAGSGGGCGSGIDESSSQQIDRYCTECDIRFNNVKTYHAHKLHYCSSRRTDGQITPKLEVSTANAIKTASVAAAISPQTTRTKTPTPAMVAAAAAAAAAASLQPSPQPFLALPTNPILIIPYSLIRAASLIPGPLTSVSPSIVNPETTCFTLDGGALKPLATALNINALNANTTVNNSATSAAVNQLNAAVADTTRQSHMQTNESLLTEKNASRNMEINESVSAKRKEGSLRETVPLDLSLRRSPIAAILQKQRFRSASAFLDPEQRRYDMEVLLEASKENLSLDESGSITPEQIVCAPSLPNSPSMSPSPKRRTTSPRSSGAGSTSSMSPPANVSTASLAAAASNMLENLPLINPLLAKQNLELALKLSAAAAAAVNSSVGNVSTSSTPAELAAAAVVAAGKSSLLGLPVLPSNTGTTGSASAGSGGQPQMYVKQGVSKCKECNIVFCKYENYLAHKQHYCSARNQDTGDADVKVSNTPPMAASASTTETTPVAYQQLICAACGIKYTSLDNLRAHQNYYCPKGGGAATAVSASLTAAITEPAPLTLPKEKCAKCKVVHEIGLPCPPPTALQQQQQPTQHIPAATGVNTNPNSVHQNVYKCPVCDAISLTASESRKHMETHGTVKAFRCSICRYKGNTLRGMRTHIRMHFDKKTSDFNEEHYMSCILEDDNIEIPSAATVQQQQQQQQQQLQQAAAAAAASLQQQQQQQQQQVFNCDICNYSSSYKGNVLRHMKLVHPLVPINSPSISPEAAEYDIPDATSLSGSLNGDNGVHGFTIKSEPMEHGTPVSNLKAAAPNINYSNLHDNNNSPITTPLPTQSSAAIPATNISSNELLHHIKSEPMDIGISIDGSTHQLPGLSSPAIAPPPPPPLNTAPEDNSVNSANAAAAAAAAAAAVSQKYCQTCDISFNYMKTFLAHKQFYCKSKILRPEANESPSPNANIMPAVASPNSMLLQKNKENLQQEAAI